MYKVDLGDSFYVVPRDAVTLNGLPLSQLNDAPTDYKGDLCLIMPDGKAAMGEDGRRPYRYQTIDEARADMQTLQEHVFNKKPKPARRHKRHQPTKEEVVITTHPDARCGQCQNCKHVATTKTILLGQSTPAGKGLDQTHVTLWNKTLEENPCLHPLVLVHHNNHTVLGRIKDQVNYSDGKPIHFFVDTAHFGKLQVEFSKVEPWTPEKALDGIDYKVLCEALGNMPMTWYSDLLRVVAEAAKKKGVFQPGRMTAFIQSIENGT